ncbi:hypothetical protein EG856_01830 [Mycoplasmopsis phocirhinis]|uniref:Uncharacterized protein n=1 Tax=Mycoplasmopsis phocirhinis TaxID=142650 RepID=A0A4P6MPJ0_9BACT|nr:hypothetical protein [Mycoplasmopsis phocirhinis]QBF34656.1 hypothetical protein EG856_01830 [Mycoplasmopsis phocirhinis]
MKFKPINDTSTIEMVKADTDLKIVSSKKTYDTQNQYSNRERSTIRTETNIKTINITLSFLIMFVSLFFIASSFFKIPPFNEKNYIGYVVVFSFCAFIFFALGIKNAIEKRAWKKAIELNGASRNMGDYALNNTFHIAYRSIILKNINLTWILVFILTYVGVITAVIYGLYNIGKVDFELDVFGGKIITNLDFAKWLDSAFGNTLLFCLISVLSMSALIVFYVIMRLVDKKRLSDLENYLGDRSVQIHEQIQKAKKDRNRAWGIAYAVLVILTILIPLALIVFAIWRAIRRKKVKLIK